MPTGRAAKQLQIACLLRRLVNPASPNCARSDDPTILAWGLANEPRCEGDRACSVVPFWADSTARHLKSLDPNHLVTLVGVCDCV